MALFLIFLRSSSHQMTRCCSDGLSNMIEDDEIRDIISGTDDLNEACRKLIDRANYYGGKDNISAVVVAIDWEE